MQAGFTSRIYKIFKIVRIFGIYKQDLQDLQDRSRICKQDLQDFQDCQDYGNFIFRLGWGFVRRVVVAWERLRSGDLNLQRDVVVVVCRCGHGIGSG